MKEKGKRADIIRTPLGLALSVVLSFGMVPANAFALEEADIGVSTPEVLEGEPAVEDTDAVTSSEAESPSVDGTDIGADDEATESDAESSDIELETSAVEEESTDQQEEPSATELEDLALPSGGSFKYGSADLEGWEINLSSLYYLYNEESAGMLWAVSIDSPSLYIDLDSDGTAYVDFDYGTHEVSFTPQEGYQWEDGTSGTKTVTLTIKGETLQSPKGGTFLGADSADLEAWRQGLAQQYCTSADDGWNWSVYIDSPTLDFYRGDGEMCVDFAPGTHQVTFTPADGYQWDDGGTAAKTVTLRIVVASLAAPKGGSFLYDSDDLWTWKDSVRKNYASKCTISSQTFDPNAKNESIPVGSYQVIFTPKDGFKWSDGTTGQKVVDLVVLEREPESAVVPAGGSFALGSSDLNAWAVGNLKGAGIKASCETLDLSNPSSWTAGTHKVVFKLNEGYLWEDGSAEAKTVELELYKSVPLPKGGSYVIGDNELSSWCDSNLNKPEFIASCYTLALANPDTWKPGSHVVRYFLEEGYRWADGTKGVKTVNLSLTGSQELIKGGTFVLDSDALETWEKNNIKNVHATPVCQTLNLAYPSTWSAGNHSIEYILDDGYCWSDGSTGSKIVELKLMGSVAIPKDGIFAQGSRELLKWAEANLNSDCVTASCAGVDLNNPASWTSGEYEITFTPKNNYVWEDGTANTKRATVCIEGSVSLPKGGSYELGSNELAAWRKANIDKAGVTATCRTIALDDPESWKPGKHTIEFFLDRGMLWENNSSAPVSVDVTLLATEEIPQSGTFVLESDELSDWCKKNLEGIHASASCGTLALSDPGSWKSGKHSLRFTLEEGYQWSDGTTAPKTVTLNLEGIDIAGLDAKLSYESTTYTGSKCEPTVSFDAADLVLNSDYSVSYANNVNAGTATVTITGKGRYAGSVEKTFAIKPATLSGASLKLSYSYCTANNYYRKPTTTVVRSGKTLSSSSDYSVAYSNNKAVGFGKVTVTGKGNYTGTLTGKFTILPSKQGWNLVGGYYYYRENNKLVTGWKTIGSSKYYLSTSTGRMLKGLYSIGGKRYYFNSSGAMRKNAWQTVGSYRYYLTSTGAAKTGWLRYNNNWYYFDPSTNRMVTGSRTIDGEVYRFSSSGVML
ncbi:MAG: hypothetical protein Q4B51_02495 [Coriobacteriaceae bacterium]|nr:hypothetical protein [Coriobacteriaceae bacterium]